MVIRRAISLGPWAERAIYASALLSSDVAPPVPTAIDTATQITELLDAGESELLLEDRLSSTRWRRLSPGRFSHETSFIEAKGRVLDIVPIEATQFEGTYRILAEQGEWEMSIAITEAGTLTEFSVRELQPIVRSPPVALPVRGEWQVDWGGDDISINRHAKERSDRRAVDLTFVDGEGNHHRGQGLENRDYHAYGQPVHAMAAGQVFMVVDGVPDNQPGKVETAHRLGNVIVIQHEADMFSVYAHLIPGSAKVEPGERVEPGQVVAACGNSGSSRQPHLHVHLQDGPMVGKAWGIEPVFADAVVERDGVRARMTNVSLVKGDLVSSP